FSSARDLAAFLAACIDGEAIDPQLRQALQMTQRESRSERASCRERVESKVCAGGLKKIRKSIIAYEKEEMTSTTTSIGVDMYADPTVYPTLCSFRLACAGLRPALFFFKQKTAYEIET